MTVESIYFDKVLLTLKNFSSFKRKECRGHFEVECSANREIQLINMVYLSSFCIYIKLFWL